MEVGEINLFRQISLHQDSFIDSISKGNTVQAHYILENDYIDPNFLCTRLDKTPLMLACKKGFYVLVSEMISMSICNPLIENNKGRNCFVYSVKYNHFDIVKLLENISGILPIFKIKNSKISDHFNINMLLLGVLTSNEPMVRHFLKNGQGVIDPNEKDSIGNTPLLISIFNLDLPLVRALLEDPRTEPNLGNLNIDFQDTPLIYSTISEYFEVVELLLGHPRIDPNLPNEDNLTPLFISVRNNNLPIVNLLLNDRRIDVNKNSGIFGRPLEYACLHQMYECVQLLISHSNILMESNYYVEQVINQICLPFETTEVNEQQPSLDTHRTSETATENNSYNQKLEEYTHVSEF